MPVTYTDMIIDMIKNININLVIFLIIILLIVLYFTKTVRDISYSIESDESNKEKTKEKFGMSPGVVDQMASTRVISKKEEDIDDTIYDNLTRQGIINMTESGYTPGSDYATA